MNSIPAEKQSVLELKCLGTNVVGTKVYRTAFSGILSSGGHLHFDWLPPNRIIAHYHKVDLISTLLDALTTQDAPRRSRRGSPPAHIENEWLPATLTLSPAALWTHSKAQFILLHRTYAVASTPKAVRQFSFILLRRLPRRRAVHMRTASVQCPRACCWCNPQYHGKCWRRSASSEKPWRRQINIIKSLFKTIKRRQQRNRRRWHSFNLHKDVYHGRSTLFVADN